MACLELYLKFIFDLIDLNLDFKFSLIILCVTLTHLTLTIVQIFCEMDIQGVSRFDFIIYAACWIDYQLHMTAIRRCQDPGHMVSTQILLLWSIGCGKININLNYSKRHFGNVILEHFPKNLNRTESLSFGETWTGQAKQFQ